MSVYREEIDHSLEEVRRLANSLGGPGEYSLLAAIEALEVLLAAVEVLLMEARSREVVE